MSRAWSVEQLISSWKSRSKITDEHWLYLGAKSRDGYGWVRFLGRLVPIHRAIASVHLGLDLDSNLLALHKSSCPYKNCWNPNCIYIGTDKDNTEDSCLAGTHKGWRTNRWKR